MKTLTSPWTDESGLPFRLMTTVKESNNKRDKSDKRDKLVWLGGTFITSSSGHMLFLRALYTEPEGLAFLTRY